MKYHDFSSHNFYDHLMNEIILEFYEYMNHFSTLICMVLWWLEFEEIKLDNYPHFPFWKSKPWVQNKTHHHFSTFCLLIFFKCVFLIMYEWMCTFKWIIKSYLFIILLFYFSLKTLGLLIGKCVEWLYFYALIYFECLSEWKEDYHLYKNIEGTWTRP